MLKIIIVASWILASVASAQTGGVLFAPLGLTWGATPTEVDQVLIHSNFILTPNQGGAVETFLDERRYAGEVLGFPADHVAPLFFASQLFGVAVSFSPAPTRLASMIWEATVEKLTQAYGRPVMRSKPTQIISWNAVLRLLPEEANKSLIMTLYNQAEKDPAMGRGIINDLQVQIGLWVPEATWLFSNGASVKAVMRAGANGVYGLRSLKPAVLYTRYEQLK